MGLSIIDLDMGITETLWWKDMFPNKLGSLSCFDSFTGSGYDHHSVSSEADELHPNEGPGKSIRKSSDGVWDVCRDGSLSVTAAPLKHRVTCFGYVIQEDAFPGKLDPALLKERGIPPGPLYAKIKNGESIIAPDGSQICPGDVVGPPRPGRKIVILGDTCDSIQIAASAMNADVLVHEATQENGMAEKAVEHGHSTPGEFQDNYREVSAAANSLEGSDIGISKGSGDHGTPATVHYPHLPQWRATILTCRRGGRVCQAASKQCRENAYQAEPHGIWSLLGGNCWPMISWLWS